MKPTPEEGRLPKAQEQNAALSAAFCEHALKVARERAHYYHFWAEEGEEIAGSFLAHILEDPNTFFRHRLQGDALEAWLFRSADNWVLKAYRSQKRRRKGEVLLSDLRQGERQTLSGSIPAPELSPEALAIRQELRRRVRQAVLRLPPNQQALYVAFYVHQRSIKEVARSSHRTIGAICGALRLLRRRMLVLLTWAGLGEAEIREYQHLIYRV